MNSFDKAIMMLKDGGFSCSQAVVATLGEQVGVERKQALRLAAGFGGGIALQGDICGIVSGAIMAIGLKYGNDETSKDGRKKVFFLAQQLIERIKAKHGCYAPFIALITTPYVPTKTTLFPAFCCHNIISIMIDIL